MSSLLFPRLFNRFSSLSRPLTAFTVLFRSQPGKYFNMKAFVKNVILFFILFVPFSAASRLVRPQTENTGKESQNMQIKGHIPRQGINYEVAGSTIPDCTHACGSCVPCNRVTVSFKCFNSDACPIAYRCMCKGKIFPVPSPRPRP